MSVTQPLRNEHRELLPRVESLRVAAEAAESDGDGLRALLDEALAFLEGQLIPHAQAEDAELYPKVEQVMQAPGATRTMQRDHVEVLVLTQELTRLRDSLTDAPTGDQRRALQRTLYGLYAVVRLHFAKEEEVTCRCSMRACHRRKPQRCSVRCTRPLNRATTPSRWLEVCASPQWSPTRSYTAAAVLSPASAI